MPRRLTYAEKLDRAERKRLAQERKKLQRDERARQKELRRQERQSQIELNRELTRRNKLANAETRRRNQSKRKSNRYTKRVVRGVWHKFI